MTLTHALKKGLTIFSMKSEEPECVCHLAGAGARDAAQRTLMRALRLEVDHLVEFDVVALRQPQHFPFYR